MTANRRADGLNVIFSVFLGLMVTAFVGIGVYTFHPPPDADPRLEELSAEEAALAVTRPGGDVPDVDQQQLREISEERRTLWEQERRVRDAWGRQMSIILIAFATLAMAVSLVRADQLPVISNGLLLGGVFTMLYGVGWMVTTENATSRFVVIAVALALTLGLGYLRFVRHGQPAESVRSPAMPADVSDLDRRVRRLEERMAEAARAFDGEE